MGKILYCCVVVILMLQIVWPASSDLQEWNDVEPQSSHWIDQRKGFIAPGRVGHMIQNRNKSLKNKLKGPYKRKPQPGQKRKPLQPRNKRPMQNYGTGQKLMSYMKEDSIVSHIPMFPPVLLDS